MPFVTQEHRLHPDPEIPGDRCYIEYQKMMDAWRANPRWTTVDKLAQQLIGYVTGGATTPYKASALLAFVVFFNLHVMPYEFKKREENGEI